MGAPSDIGQVATSFKVNGSKKTSKRFKEHSLDAVNNIILLRQTSSITVSVVFSFCCVFKSLNMFVEGDVQQQQQRGCKTSPCCPRPLGPRLCTAQVMVRSPTERWTEGLEGLNSGDLEIGVAEGLNQWHPDSPSGVFPLWSMLVSAEHWEKLRQTGAGADRNTWWCWIESGYRLIPWNPFHSMRIAVNNLWTLLVEEGLGGFEASSWPSSVCRTGGVQQRSHGRSMVKSTVPSYSSLQT